jgi:hypothetical protein
MQGRIRQIATFQGKTRGVREVAMVVPVHPSVGGVVCPNLFSKLHTNNKHNHYPWHPTVRESTL